VFRLFLRSSNGTGRSVVRVSARAQSSGTPVGERERALENMAVLKHEQEQLNALAKKLGLTVAPHAGAADAAAAKKISAVTVVGAGLMGAGEWREREERERVPVVQFFNLGCRSRLTRLFRHRSSRCAKGLSRASGGPH
jgi:hypothetical protein